jgi:adhesin transport system membrane fusion protein
MDLPLIELGQEVRFIFDGWPAFIFSGWPGQSFGTYSGSVVAIDNMISKNGEYRILVGADPGGKPWPEALRVGSGAQGIALLNNVPLWYEIWRRLNGFPPDYYDAEDGDMGDGEDVKMKAPAKSIK